MRKMRSSPQLFILAIGLVLVSFQTSVAGVRDSVYTISSARMTHPQAVTYCSQYGAHLVQIDSEDEQSYVVDLLNLNRISHHNNTLHVWTDGVRDEDCSCSFHWGTSNQPIRYTHWGSCEPNDHEEAEDCLHLDGNRGFDWNDTSCNWKCNALCEKERGEN